jgi:predicted nucleic acid-binding protein
MRPRLPVGVAPAAVFLVAQHLPGEAPGSASRVGRGPECGAAGDRIPGAARARPEAKRPDGADDRHYASSRVATTISAAKAKAAFAECIRRAYDTAAARVYGQVRARLESAGRPLADADLQIAATALLHDLELVTGNVKHFKRVPGLRISPVLTEARTRS